MAATYVKPGELGLNWNRQWKSTVSQYGLMEKLS